MQTAKRLAAIVALLSLITGPGWAANTSDYFTKGDSVTGGGPAAFITFQRCEGGTNDGKLCTIAGDCPSGACVTAKYPMCAFIGRPDVTRNAERRTAGTTAVNAFSATQAGPCDQVRIINLTGNGGRVYVGYAGVTVSTGVPVEIGGAWTMVTKNQDCNSVQVLCDTLDTGCSSNGYKFEAVTP
jgi:hypothetical protein